MYQVGDVVYYDNIGVCRVTDLKNHDVPGFDKPQPYYTLNPLYQQCVIHTPVNNPKVFIRPAMSRQAADKLIDLIPTIRVKPYHSKGAGELAEHYKESIVSHDCADLLELTMSIHAKKIELLEKKKKFGSVDEKYLKKAEDLLFGELAVALDIDKEDVPGYIAERVESVSVQGELA